MLYINEKNIYDHVGIDHPDVTQSSWNLTNLDLSLIRSIDFPSLKTLILTNGKVTMDMLTHLDLDMITTRWCSVTLTLTPPNTFSNLKTLDLIGSSVTDADLTQAMLGYESLVQLRLGDNVNRPFLTDPATLPKVFLPNLLILDRPGVPRSESPVTEMLLLRNLRKATYSSSTGCSRNCHTDIWAWSSSNHGFSIGKIERNVRGCSDVIIDGRRVFCKKDRIISWMVSARLNEEICRNSRSSLPEIRTFAAACISQKNVPNIPSGSLASIRSVNPESGIRINRQSEALCDPFNCHVKLDLIDDALEGILRDPRVNPFYIRTAFELFQTFAAAENMSRSQTITETYIEKLLMRKDRFVYCHTGDLTSGSPLENIYYFFASCSIHADPELENPVLQRLRLILTCCSIEDSKIPYLPNEILLIIGEFLR